MSDSETRICYLCRKPTPAADRRCVHCGAILIRPGAGPG